MPSGWSRSCWWRRVSLEWPSDAPGPTVGKHAERIIGGQDAARGAYQWMVIPILFFGDDPWACAGTLIDPNWVLTAGNCIVGDAGRMPDNSSVFIGNYIHDAFDENYTLTNQSPSPNDTATTPSLCIRTKTGEQTISLSSICKPRQRYHR